MINVRNAGDLDASNMADLLNEIIRIGGTTALTQDVTAETLQAWFRQEPERSVWHIAEDDTGVLLGFQYIRPNEALPPDACSIATFVRVGQTGLESALYVHCTQYV